MDFKHNEAEDFHVFVSDSKWMKELGLSTFTTGTLYDWWYHRGQGGEFINRKLVLRDESYITPDVFFTFDDMGLISSVGEASVWRFAGDNKGKYEDKKFDDTWAYGDGRPEVDNKPWHGKNYTKSTVNIGDFQATKWVPATGNDINDGEKVNLVEPQRLRGLADADGGIHEVTNIVAMNDWVRDYLSKEPDLSKWNDEAQARHRFIEDIKTSKSGCLTYPVSVTFDVAPGQLFSDGAGNLVPAYKTETFNIQLYLYDERSERKTGRTAIMSAMKHAAVPKDITGRPGVPEDGELAETDDKPENKVVGDVDLHMNHMTGKWQSGSKQMLAKITQAVPSATWSATSKDLEDQDNKDVLDDPEDPKHLVLGSGAAIPITMQNGNPMQWTPNYVLPKDCRKDNKEKFKVVVHNPDPGRGWEKDKIVILNEINGLWMPLEFGSGVPTDQQIVDSVFEGRWDFTYFATSLQYFFRDKNNARITPERAEKAFHVQYYYGDQDNWDTDPAQSPHLYTRNISAFETYGDGYHQFTSFDFMDRYVGGTRGETRSLGATLYGQDPIGTVINEPPTETSGPFFGCVFPDGYKGVDGDIDRNGAEYYSDTRNFEVSPRQDYKFFNTGGVLSTEVAFDGGTDMESVRHAYTESPTIVDPSDLSKVIQPAMFADIFNGDHAVPHLPADIAMNASPSGSYGRPLTSLYEITKAVHGGKTGGALRTHLKDNFFYSSGDPLGNCAYNWLYKQKYTDGDIVSHDSSVGGGAFYTGFGAADDSAYDFQPKTANKIQFRPLKAEVYAGITPQDETASVPAQFERRDFYHYGQRKMTAGTLVSKTSRDREKMLGPGGFNNLYMNGANDTSTHPAFGLSFNVDYPASLFGSNDPSEHFSDTSWALDWCHNPWQPAGAVGVIGSICTISATSLVNFTTNQKFGMKSEYSRPGGSVLSLATMGGVVNVGVGGNSKYSTTWGGPSLKYNDFHTTDLSARIYHAWPREQTIYDPRFFAVHHFNNGTTNFDVPVRREGQDTNGDGIPDHNIAIADSTVDIREPTYVVPADQNNAILTNPTRLLANNSTNLVFGDVVKLGVGGDNHPILSSGQWEINKIRRGKLLPFNYSYNRMAFPWDMGDEIRVAHSAAGGQGAGIYFSGGVPQTSSTAAGTNNKYIDEPNIDGAQTKSPWIVDVVVQDLGKNYKVGDRFTIAGSDCTLKVSETTTFLVTSGTDSYTYAGCVSAFEMLNSGTYFDHTKLFNLSNKGDISEANMNRLKSFTQGSAKIEPFSSASVHGKGFKAYLVQGRVKTMDATDAKPQMGTSIDYFQLSLPAPNYTKEHQGVKQMLEGQKVTQATLDNPSSDGKYDIFFHFHNDISHTYWSRGDWGGGKHNNEDQYIDLTIDVA